MAVETYEAIIKIPIGKKPCTLTIDRKGDGTFEGEFSVLGSTAPVGNGRSTTTAISPATAPSPPSSARWRALPKAACGTA